LIKILLVVCSWDCPKKKKRIKGRKNRERKKETVVDVKGKKGEPLVVIKTTSKIERGSNMTQYPP